MTAGAWRLAERDGVVVALCGALESIDGIAHAFSTRRCDDVGEFDTGGAGEVSAAVRERRRRLVRAAGLDREAEPVVLRQEHGATVLRARDARDGATGDAAWWCDADGSSRPPSVRTADCVPILIVDRRGRTAAAVHAGWRGTAQGIAGRTVERLIAEGSTPDDLVGALGPAILRCCYEVEPDVRDRLSEASGHAPGLAEPANRPGRVLVDLHAANRVQLERAGLDPARILAAPWCTKCHEDLFFSFRRDGESAGRHMAVVGRAASARRP